MISTPSSRFSTLYRSAACFIVLTALGGILAPAHAQDRSTTPGVQSAGSLGSPAANEAPTDFNQPIQPLFVVNVTVAGESEPSGDYAVDAAGNVNIRYANIATPVSIRGMRPAEAATAITTFLKTYIKNPEVTVRIISVPRPTVKVNGAVRHSGSVAVPTGTTLLDVLLQAEWLDTADLSKVVVTRAEPVNGAPKRQVIAFDKYISPGQLDSPDESQNVVLHDKDTVLVPFKSLPGNSVVAVDGEVGKPTETLPIRLNPPMTIREAINLAGGPLPTANHKRILLRRPGVQTPMVIDLDKANQNDPTQNVELKPGDVIYVEPLSNDAYVNVVGGFVKPGKQLLDRPLTLTQAVNQAGGTVLGAKETKGMIYRTNATTGQTKLLPFNWKLVEDGKAQDILLQPGDTVVIASGPPPVQRDALTTAGQFASVLSGFFSLLVLLK